MPIKAFWFALLATAVLQTFLSPTCYGARMVMMGGSQPAEVIYGNPDVRVETVNLPDVVQTINETQIVQVPSQVVQSEPAIRVARLDALFQNTVYRAQLLRAQPPSLIRDNYLGCYIDSAARELPYNILNMGIQARTRVCRNHCKDYPFFGLQGGEYCFCGSLFGYLGLVNDAECNIPCTGDKSTTCGGLWRNQIYSTTSEIRPDWKEDGLGCYADRADRDLTSPVNFLKDLRSGCLEHCRSKKYRYFALQSGGMCFCGNSFGRHGRVSRGECNSRCPYPDTILTCGGPWRNEIYDTGFMISPNVGNAWPPTYLSLRLGCFIDGPNRDFPVIYHPHHSEGSVGFCLAFCKVRNYLYFGVQYGGWCFCGNSYGRLGKASESDCNSRCWGDNSVTCGGPWRNEVFKTGN